MAVLRSAPFGHTCLAPSLEPWRHPSTPRRRKVTAGSCLSSRRLMGTPTPGTSNQALHGVACAESWYDEAGAAVHCAKSAGVARARALRGFSAACQVRRPGVSTRLDSARDGQGVGGIRRARLPLEKTINLRYSVYRAHSSCLRAFESLASIQRGIRRVAIPYTIPLVLTESMRGLQRAEVAVEGGGLSCGLFVHNSYRHPERVRDTDSANPCSRISRATTIFPGSPSVEVDDPATPSPPPLETLWAGNPCSSALAGHAPAPGHEAQAESVAGLPSSVGGEAESSSLDERREIGAAPPGARHMRSLRAPFLVGEQARLSETTRRCRRRQAPGDPQG